MDPTCAVIMLDSNELILGVKNQVVFFDVGESSVNQYQQIGFADKVIMMYNIENKEKLKL